MSFVVQEVPYHGGHRGTRKRMGSGDPPGLQNRRAAGILSPVRSTRTRFRHVDRARVTCITDLAFAIMLKVLGEYCDNTYEFVALPLLRMCLAPRVSPDHKRWILLRSSLRPK